MPSFSLSTTRGITRTTDHFENCAMPHSPHDRLSTCQRPRQTLCSGRCPGDILVCSFGFLAPTAFPLLTIRITTRLAGMNFGEWSIFTAGGAPHSMEKPPSPSPSKVSVTVCLDQRLHQKHTRLNAGAWQQTNNKAKLSGFFVKAPQFLLSQGRVPRGNRVCMLLILNMLLTCVLAQCNREAMVVRARKG